MYVGDHYKQLLCYVAKLDVYFVVLGNEWLQTHNPMIDWKKPIMKFNSASCIEKKCFSLDILCVKFAVDNKAKHKIKDKKFTTVDDIDIKPVSAKHFFCEIYASHWYSRIAYSTVQVNIYIFYKLYGLVGKAIHPFFTSFAWHAQKTMKAIYKKYS